MTENIFFVLFNLWCVLWLNPSYKAVGGEKFLVFIVSLLQLLMCAYFVDLVIVDVTSKIIANR